MKSLTEQQKKMIKVGAPLLVLLLAAIIAMALLNKPTRAGIRPPMAEVAKWVEVVTVHREQVMPKVVARGLVSPAHKIDIKSRVEGEVINVSPKLIPGAQVKKGELLLAVEDADYQSALAKAKAELAQARADLHIEKGQQSVAYQEYQLIGEELPTAQRSLILRQPQLKSAEAQVASMQAAVNKAELNLTRTQIRAPFDGIIVDKSVDLGSSVSVNSSLLGLLASDEFWITVTLPPKQLQWIDIPTADSPLASKVNVVTSGGQQRQATVLRLIPELTSTTRQAQLLISLKDPLALTANKLAAAPAVMANEYVKAIIHGRPVDGLVALPRGAIRDGDKVWLMSDENRLAVRDVQILYRGAEQVYIGAGLTDGERVITSLMKTPVVGTLLKAITTNVDVGEGDDAVVSELDEVIES
ncbi:RND family efflux transporter MFP subunit [Sinobacterium caligoides]|uniref:RND family efflux transporter MFP subunit n=1 Tax=Sinobacterium caligoides TaxID=933926 RepID=A0A3N2DXX1_9GAMM|nr:efflux RND transporter periplasmic adaptor subunit [Sinobacterium caligoides]ROS04681.1 RND family efflux transporter MFP subunit [Sinobacterium caligoides]